MADQSNAYAEMPIGIQGHYSDLNQLDAALRGWHIDNLQLEAGKLDAVVMQVHHPRFILTRGVYNRKIDQHGAAPSGYRTFGITTGGDGSAKWCGREIDDSTVLVFGADREFCAARPADTILYTLAIREQDLELCGEMIGYSVDDELRRDQHTAVVCDPRVTEALRRRFNFLCEAIQAHPRMTRSRTAVDELVTNLPATLLMALATSKGRARKSLPPLKHSALERAHHYIAAHGDQHISMKDLCRVGHATWETVNTAFLEYYGITARHYLMALRMDAVRRSLRDNPRRPITEVAAELGFWQVDQFIKRYARQFGEFPSETRAAQIVADSRVH